LYRASSISAISLAARMQKALSEKYLIGHRGNSLNSPGSSSYVMTAFGQ
jgi:hypothetical protein